MGGGSPAQRIFLFHSVRKNRISLAPGFPENELANFRGFADANITREAYLTAEGDFTAASAAQGGGSPVGNKVAEIYSVATLGGAHPNNPQTPLTPPKVVSLTLGRASFRQKADRKTRRLKQYEQKREDERGTFFPAAG